MRIAIVDCETNGLLDELDRVHCLVLRDYETNHVLSCADQPGYTPIRDGLATLSKAEVIIAHNGIAFDIPALQKVYPEWTYTGKVWDTLVVARTRWAHIKELDYDLFRRKQLPGNLIGRQSLKAWGYRLGVLKGDYGDTSDWSTWSPEMQTYCERDVLVTAKLARRLKKDGLEKRAIDAELELAGILAAMERGGWPFDVEKAQLLHATLAGKRETVAQRLREAFGQFYQRNGPEKVAKRANKKRGIIEGAIYQNLKVVDFNPGSRDHIANRLIQLYGWKPDEFGDDGKPTVDETVLKGLPYPEIPDICEYLLLDKRIGQLSEGKQAWLRLATDERAEGGKITGLTHIHGSTNAGGTVTHRASHSHPNVAQVPKVGKPYGEECRSLYTVPADWKLVGADMSGLELRCLAHYMARWDDLAYGRSILEGRNEDKTDIHSINQQALGFAYAPAEGRSTKGRDAAKTWFYAYLYGAGDEKLGTVGYPTLSQTERKRRGGELRRRFEGGLPALGYLTERLKAKAKEQKWIALIDGRRSYVRSDHAVLNTLLQGTGAVLCKHWVVELCRRLTEQLGPMGWDRQWFLCGWIHDEVQIATREEHAALVAKIAVEAAEAMTERFAFRCPLTGEAKIGTDWASTH